MRAYGQLALWLENLSSREAFAHALPFYTYFLWCRVLHLLPTLYYSGDFNASLRFELYLALQFVRLSKLSCLKKRLRA
jgi:hypothetical protein